jgi:hypothetical protein
VLRNRLLLLVLLLLLLLLLMMMAFHAPCSRGGRLYIPRVATKYCQFLLPAMNPTYAPELIPAMIAA